MEGILHSNERDRDITKIRIFKLRYEEMLTFDSNLGVMGDEICCCALRNWEELGVLRLQLRK